MSAIAYFQHIKISIMTQPLWLSAQNCKFSEIPLSGNPQLESAWIKKTNSKYRSLAQSLAMCHARILTFCAAIQRVFSNKKS